MLSFFNEFSGKINFGMLILASRLTFWLLFNLSLVIIKIIFGNNSAGNQIYNLKHGELNHHEFKKLCTVRRCSSHNGL